MYRDRGSSLGGLPSSPYAHGEAGDQLDRAPLVALGRLTVDVAVVVERLLDVGEVPSASNQGLDVAMLGMPGQNTGPGHLPPVHLDPE